MAAAARKYVTTCTENAPPPENPAAVPGNPGLTRCSSASALLPPSRASPRVPARNLLAPAVAGFPGLRGEEPLLARGTPPPEGKKGAGSGAPPPPEERRAEPLARGLLSAQLSVK
eukprot:6294062-Pyramimonas_sp.AAC.1